LEKKNIAMFTKSIKHIQVVSKHFPDTNVPLLKSINKEHLKLGEKIAASLQGSVTNADVSLLTLTQFLSNDQPVHVEDNTLVVTVGGDGTFLHSAHKIKNNKSYILGVNSKPTKSIGKLCSFNLIAEGCDDEG
jgi:NAD kinase